MPPDPTTSQVTRSLQRKRKFPSGEPPIAVLSRALITKTGSVIFDVQAIADHDAAALMTVQQFLGIGETIGGVTVTGTPTAGQVIRATDGTSATWSDSGGVTADTGWTANESAGDKAAIVLDYPGPGMGFAGADTVDLTLILALGGQVTALTKKFQALEAALSSDPPLLPNA